MDILIFLSEFMVPIIIFYIVGFGVLSKRPVFDDFLKGAADGMKTVAGIMPTLIGLSDITSNPFFPCQRPDRLYSASSASSSSTASIAARLSP